MTMTTRVMADVSIDRDEPVVLNLGDGQLRRLPDAGLEPERSQCAPSV
jgi:hypothetical protein